MRFFLLMAVFGVTALVLETTWLAGLPAESLRFDFMVIAVAGLAFFFEWRKALPSVIFYGLLMDVTSAGLVGMSLFSYVVIYGFLRTIVAKISFQAGPALLFWVGVVSLVDKALGSLLFLAAGDALTAGIILRLAPGQAMLDAAVGLALIPFLRWYTHLSWEEIRRPRGLVLK